MASKRRKTEPTPEEPLYSCRAFREFGPSRFAVGPAPLSQVRGKRGIELRLRLKELCPRRPGVYGLLNAHEELIYVGKAKSLRARLLGYFRRRGRDRRTARLAGRTRAIVWEQTPSEFAALLRELELIQRWRPRGNVQGQSWRWLRAFLCLGGRPAPHVFLRRRPPPPSVACFGPLPVGKRLHAALRHLHDTFLLRDCSQSVPMIFAGEDELFPVLRTPACLRHELGTCLGPCAAACTEDVYEQKVREARAFLEGSDRALLEEVEHQMSEASGRLAFERAALLRDRLEALSWLDSRLERLRQVRRAHAFIYPVRGYEARATWYVIHGGWVGDVLLEPQSEAERREAARRVSAVFAGAAVPASAADLDVVYLVAAWFRRHPQELKRVQPAP